MRVLTIAVAALCAASSVNAFAAIKAGDKIPAVELHKGFNPVEKVNMAEYAANKNMLVIGLPGAFTPT